MTRKRALLWIAVSSDKQAGGDKISLTEQERAEREWCEANDCDVVGVLSVPGESRSESDVLTIFEDFAEKGVFAYHDLRRMWQHPRQFDVLVAYHDTRLGRSEALYTYVISNVMKAGAQIYCILGGWYEPKDYKLKMAIGMINVSSEMDRLVELTRATNLNKAKLGTLVHGYPCMGYKVERGSKGEALRKVLDESKRLTIETAARCVVEGVGWKHVESTLATEHGIFNGAKPFTRYTFYYLFHNANFWGNEIISSTKARKRRGTGVKSQELDLWVFDPSYPTPEHTQIFYGVLPPFLPEGSELSESLKTELRRRRHSIRGSARPRNSHKFTGLLSCYYCGRNLVFHPIGYQKYPTYTCHSKYNSTQANRCTKTRSIREGTVEDWLDLELRKALQKQDPEHFLRRDDQQGRENQLKQYEALEKELNQKIDRVMDEQELTQDEDILSRLRSRRETYSAELTKVKHQISTLENQASYDASAAHEAFNKLATYPTLEAFWNDNHTTINQILHGLFGENVLVIRDRAVRGRALRNK